MAATAVRARRVPFWLLIFSLAIGGTAFAVGVLSSVGQWAEASVLGAAAFTTDPPPPLNLVSIPAVILVLAITGGLALAVHGIRRACAVVLVPAITIVASQLLKQEFLRRPGLFELDAPNTFPSGHMTVFTILLTAVVWAVPAKARALAALVGSVVLCIVAWQLLAYGWHRPSDVVGSLMLSIAVASIFALVVPGSRTRRAILGMPIARLLTALGVIALLACLVVIAITLASPNTGSMLLAGEIGVVGAALLSSRAILALSAR